MDYSLKLNALLKGKGYYSVPTGSHDQVRLAEKKDKDLLKCAFALLLTWSQVPFIYYGDEIGIKHTFGINKDGGYIRTGARTPMLWDESKNKGFSTSDETYLPVNYEIESVEIQEKQENSLLNTVKALCKLRKKYSCLDSDGQLKVEEYGSDYIIYTRKDEESGIKVIMKTGKGEKRFEDIDGEILYSNNVKKDGTAFVMQNSAFALVKAV